MRRMYPRKFVDPAKLSKDVNAWLRKLGPDPAPNFRCKLHGPDATKAMIKLRKLGVPIDQIEIE